MKERSLLLAGLVEEDDLEETRYRVSEDYEAQFEDDVKNISENVHFVEEDEIRLKRLIGESEEVDTWEDGKESLNEGADGIAMGGIGPGFSNFHGQSTGFAQAGATSNYVPSIEDTYNSIIGGHRSSNQWQEVEDPRVRLFNKISEMSSAAYDQDREELREDELPMFDEDFRPLNNESDDGNYFDELTGGLSEKYQTLQDKISNGELAVQGGIGPGFSAYDGPKEIKNPYEKADQTMSKWFMPESFQKEECDEEEIMGEEDYFSEDVVSMTSFEGFPSTVNVDGIEVRKVKAGRDRAIYETDFVKVMVERVEDGEFYAEVQDSYLGDTIGEGYGSSAAEAIQDAMADHGELPDVAPEKSTADVIPMMEEKKSLNESRDEGQSSNAWYYRRVGMTDGYHLKPRPANGSTEDAGETHMHANHPEEPSHEGSPGLPGWSFYEADPTYQKMMARKEDPLEEGEKIAVEEELMKFFKKYSVYE